MKSTILFYIAVFLRRIHYFLAVFLLVTAVSLTLANILPPVYVASTRLLVESSQIPDALAAPTVDTGAIEELQIIEQRLMTRANLLEIARSERAFDEIDTMSAGEIVRAMRDATSIRNQAGRGRATLMNLSFESSRGVTAANVVNQYATLILQVNLETRADRAGDTLEFFQTEVQRLSTELETRGAVILDFQNANSGALPDTLTFRLNQQSAMQARIATDEREIASLTEQKRRLTEVFEATGNVASDPGADLTPEQRQLASLQEQLSAALAVYSVENPRVKLIQAQIAQQEIVVSRQSTTQVSGTQQPMTTLDVSLAGLDARIDLLSEQLLQTNEQLDGITAGIEKTPANTSALASMNRDYSNIQNQYNSAVNRLSQAAAGERIELLSKGRRIAILDPATIPESPDRPNRLLIAVGGTFLGAMLGFALVFGLELLNSAIRRPADISRHLGITPIATVPYIRTPMEMVMRRATYLVVFSVLIFGVPAALFAVHTYYMPLDLLYDRIAAKIGAVI